MALPTVVGIAAIAGIVMLGNGRTARPSGEGVCLNADKQVLPTLLTRPTSLEMTHPQSVRVPLACHSKPWE